MSLQLLMARSRMNHQAQPASGFAAAVLALSPFGYWRLNDAGATAVDSSSNSNDLTWDARNGIYTPHSPSLLPSGDGASVVKTARANALRSSLTGTPPSSVWSIIAAVKASSLSNSANVVFVAGGGSQQLGVNSDGSLQAGRASYQNYTRSTVKIAIGASHLIGVSLDGTGAGSYYLDGQPAGTISGAGNCQQSSQARIGLFWDNTNYWFNGAIQDVALFGTCLTAAQHASLWSAAGG